MFRNSEIVLTPNKEFYSPSILYLLLKGLALGGKICSISIQNVDIFCPYVNVLEEVIPHEGMVAFRVISGKTLASSEMSN